MKYRLGCLFLLLTGGEPLLRSDFFEIYNHAKTNGLLVTVFTNGTRITEPILKLFKDLPPQNVEITLYGASPETYQAVTGHKEAYARCIAGIEKLLDNHIAVSLKTILMTHNRHEFHLMKRMAQDCGVEFRFDAAIFPRFSGDKTPMKFRVDPVEAMEKEFSDEGILQKWKNYLEGMEEIPTSDLLYLCGAGLTGFHVDAYGSLRPCLMITDLTYDLKGGSFLEGWQQVIPHIWRKKIGFEFACNRCEKSVVCGYCPAFFKLENGMEVIHSEYLCALGHHRSHAIENNGRSSQEEKHL